MNAKLIAAYLKLHNVMYALKGDAREIVRSRVMSLVMQMSWKELKHAQALTKQIQNMRVS